MSEPITNVEAAVRELGALPVPVGPESPVDADRAKAPWGRGEDGRPLLPMGAHWTDVPELVDRTVAGIQARVDQAQSGHWYVSPIADDLPGTVRTRVDGYPRTVGQVANMLPADLELILHAHDDLSWCLEMLAKLRARVAELEAERHTTNEALDDAVTELRTSYAERARRETHPGRRQAWRMLAQCDESERVANALLTPEAARSADKLTRMLAPTQALQLEDPHDSPLHRDYRKGRDLPELGGV